MNAIRLVASCVGLSWLCMALVPLSAQADTDACELLTPAQVGAAVNVSVIDGQHAMGQQVIKTYGKTCTWSPSAKSDVKSVTLLLQTAAQYDGGKQMAQKMAASGRGRPVKTASVGEDAYYVVLRDQVSLFVKKGDISFTVAVNATLAVDEKEAMEVTLAKDVLSKL
jgi:hypothetical protein